MTSSVGVAASSPVGSESMALPVEVGVSDVTVLIAGVNEVGGVTATEGGVVVAVCMVVG